MLFGVQCKAPLEPVEIADGGFSYMELPYEELTKYKEIAELAKKEGNAKTTKYEEAKNKYSLRISGLSYDLDRLTPDTLYEMLEACRKYHANYIVLSTMNCKPYVLEAVVEQCSMMIVDFNISIFIENGCAGDDVSGYSHGAYSDAGRLVEIVSYCNRLCDKELFGISYNIGYANLITKNIRSQLHLCARQLRMVHINDNDGRRNDKQMPYTFTKGRGDLSTDWYHIIGELFRSGFDGWMIFDTNGTFSRCPERLRTQFVRLLRAVAAEWELQSTFVERVLDRPDRKLILFGAGKMLADYMYLFGKKYPPYFAVDNGKGMWGKVISGVPIKSPDEILSVPADERNVVICCMHYEPIGQQLRAMGVEYEEFRDLYFV